MGIERLKRLHVGITLLDLVELLAHVLHSNRLISNLGERVVGDFAADRRLGDQVEQHAASQEQDHGS